MVQKQKRLLIVEDEEAMSTALVDKFTRERFSVLTARNGEEGLSVAFEERPDLILLDIVMPKMDGLQMLTKLREDTWGKNVPVILLTNYGDIDKITDAVRSNVACYLLKTDWKLENVVQKVRETLHSGD